MLIESRYVAAGSKEICRASARVIALNEDGEKQILKVESKLDTCGSVSLAHSSFLRDIRPCAEHGITSVSLNGIGGKSGLLDQAGVLSILKSNGEIVEILCYVFDKPLGSTEKVLLLSLRSTWDSQIDIVHHMCHSLNGFTKELKFVDRDSPTASKKQKKKHRAHNWLSTPDVMFSDFERKIANGAKTPQRIVKASKAYKKYVKRRQEEEEDPLLLCEIGGHRVLKAAPIWKEQEWRIEEGTGLSSDVFLTGRSDGQGSEVDHAFEEHLSLMSEIQLRRIVDRLAKTTSTQETDGDELMQKNGKTVSKFSKEAIHLGDEVGETIKGYIFKNFDKYKGFSSVFPPRNGAPRIMTKFAKVPYSYELLPEYEKGERHLPCVKAMNWTGKTATAQVIRGFVKSTPVVEKCTKPPRCISRLVIVPKYAPGQDKGDPDHGFRVCVNALINKCLKPIASTIPLATDEITKLHGKRYFLQADGSNAYWSIPVCEESKLLTAFHTPDGLYCWNRLLMGAKPSSAVQQAAYLEALDKYIDYYEDGSLRDCLKDSNGNRAKDKEGNDKTLRHSFAVYCDDIAAGADTLEELWELYDALICCCHRAGIQIKASKVKFGVKKVTFHNYTISSEGTEPKEANLCPIRSMTEPTDVRQVRAFLGCCQQLSNYVKDYGIIARPLSDLTKKGTQFPKPWIKNSPYDIAFRRLKTVMLDGSRYLHNKDASKRLFIEVDASDAGWGACAYQMVKQFTGDPLEEGRARLHDKGPRKVVQWISKSWSAHELKMPVFYRESLARLLALEKFRNLIETNIKAGVTLYTDHKPGLYESSLSNKGQLSAWRLMENSDLLSLVENLYRPGTQMLLGDPLSRVCAPTSGFYDQYLPLKIGALLKHLPDAVRECADMRVYANKDTAPVSRLVQRWRRPSNPVKQGRLMSASPNGSSFSIGTMHADAGIRDIEALLREDLAGSPRPFAILTSVTLLPEIGRQDNDSNGNLVFDENIVKRVQSLSKLVLSKTGEVWLINLPQAEKKDLVIAFEQMGCSDADAMESCENAISCFMEIIDLQDGDNHTEVWQLPMTRANKQRKNSTGDGATTTPNDILGISKFANQDPIIKWINKQLDGQTLPPEVQSTVISSIDGYPDGLLGIPSATGGEPRIIVPVYAQKDLVMSTHYSIRHQSYKKVQHILYPLCYWPGMDEDIKVWCDKCDTCKRAIVRRQHLRTKFNEQAKSPTKLPRQAYGVDFYGYHGGEILVMVDLCTRECILRRLPNRNQKGVAQTLLDAIIFSRGVPEIIRSDNAPELMQGAVMNICKYLGIQQIVTGGHNPRGNAICERVNQTLGAMIRKLSDSEYKTLAEILPSLQFAINTTYNSAIGGTPFEAGHGLPVRSITQARLDVKAVASHAVGGVEDTLEDVSTEFDKSMIHNTLELATRMAEVANSESQWNKRMNSERLNHTGRKYDPSKRLPVGTKVFFYKPPTMAETVKRGRKAKHLDHYTGPATIVAHIGTKSYKLEYEHKLDGGTTKIRRYQRDAGMVIPAEHMSTRENRARRDRSRSDLKRVSKHSSSHPPKEGEIILVKDDLEAKDWYCARITQVLVDRIKVHLYTTDSEPVEAYDKASVRARASNLRGIKFLPTWCLSRGTGEPTTTPPKGKALERDIWSMKIPLTEWDRLALVRNVRLNDNGQMDPSSIAVVSKLPIPHHVGAGGPDDYV